MLDAFIIEEQRRREREAQKQERQRPVIEAPVAPERQQPPPDTAGPREDRGVIHIGVL